MNSFLLREFLSLPSSCKSYKWFNFPLAVVVVVFTCWFFFSLLSSYNDANWQSETAPGLFTRLVITLCLGLAAVSGGGLLIRLTASIFAIFLACVRYETKRNETNLPLSSSFRHAFWMTKTQFSIARSHTRVPHADTCSSLSRWSSYSRCCGRKAQECRGKRKRPASISANTHKHTQTNTNTCTCITSIR